MPEPPARDLGKILYSTPNYNEHVTEVVSKYTASLCKINRVKQILYERSLIKIVNALVFCRLHYWPSVWCNTSKKNITKLHNVQNFAARLVTNIKKYDHMTPALEQLDWLPVRQIKRCCYGFLVPQRSSSIVLERQVYHTIRHPRPQPKK